MPPVFEHAAMWVPPALAALFAFALGAKIRDWPGIAEWFQHLGLPKARELALAGLASEALLVALLVLVPSLGLVVSVVWLVVATALLFRGQRVNAPCACFGRSTTSNKWPILRNIGLIGTAGFALASAEVLPAPLDLSASVAALGPATLLVRSIQQS